MNRKDRRAQRAQERKARRPAFQAGQRAAEKGEVPPQYIEDTGRIAAAMLAWLAAEPTLPDLKWHDMMATDTMIAAPLAGEWLEYLAATPDAIRMLEAVDAATKHVGSLYQATVALKLISQLPGGPSWLQPRTRYESQGAKELRSLGETWGDESLRIATTPCGHCGVDITGASSSSGERPTPGGLTCCIECGGFSEFDAELRLVPLSAEAFAALEPETRAVLDEMRSLLLAARAQYELRGKAKGPVPEA